MLQREIKRWDLVLLMINGTIGAGIFGLPSKIYSLAGIYSIPALILCALIVFVLVLNFAEVASRFKSTGGPYLYTLKAFGKIPAFLIGWLILITRVSTYAALINLMVTYMGYFNPIFEIDFYRYLSIIIITAILCFVNYRGIKSSTIFSNFMAIAKLLPLFIFIIVGFYYIKPDLLDFNQELPDTQSFSSAVVILIFAFTGFEALLVNTGEIQNPRKNIPFSLILSISFVAIFYVLIQIVSIGTLPGLAESEKPLADAARRFMGPYGAMFISLGAIISIGGTLNAVMLIGSRMPFAISESNQFPKILSNLHPKFSTPANALISFTLITLMASLSGSFIQAVSISVVSKVLILLVVCAALIKFRTKDTSFDYFRIPFGKFFAILGILTSLWLLYNSKMNGLRDVFISMIVGIMFFLIFKFFTKNKSS